jgi:hypothetical protein
VGYSDYRNSGLAEFGKGRAGIDLNVDIVVPRNENLQGGGLLLKRVYGREPFINVSGVHGVPGVDEYIGRTEVLEREVGVASCNQFHVGTLEKEKPAGWRVVFYNCKRLDGVYGEIRTHTGQIHNLED